METYKVIIEFPAERDLRAILVYITETLKEPVAAKRIYTSVKEQIITLRHMPLRHGLVEDEIFALQGVRKMPVQNYSVFYLVNEQLKEVHILRILYNRREWQNLL